MSLRPGKAPAYWAGYIMAVLLVVMSALRMAGNFPVRRELSIGLLALLIFSALFLLEFLFSSRVKWPWPVYFLIQCACLLFMAGLRPFLDVTTSLYMPLAVQALYYLPQRSAYGWALVFALLLMGSLVAGLGPVEGLAQAMQVIAEGIILAVLAQLVVQSQKDREQSEALVAGLKEAQSRLQEYTAQAGQLVTEQERNRLARQLHDSVGQMIFSIELTCESARMLLDRDPARVPELLERLQELTGAALNRLRSIIAELRPHNG